MPTLIALQKEDEAYSVTILQNNIIALSSHIINTDAFYTYMCYMSLYIIYFRKIVLSGFEYHAFIKLRYICRCIIKLVSFLWFLFNLVVFNKNVLKSPINDVFPNFTECDTNFALRIDC